MTTSTLRGALASTPEGLDVTVPTRLQLDTGWVVHARGGEGVDRLGDRHFPAAVPGCVHLDLMSAGGLVDPFVDDHESSASWVGATNWTFATAFQAPAVPERWRADLVCSGLDTVASISLNDHTVGEARNMHRTHRFDVTEVLRLGHNGIQVAFEAPLAAVEEAERRMGARPKVYPHPYAALRKMAASFGWDWGPDLPTTGIWRPIALELWHTARIADVRYLVEVSEDGTGVLTVPVDLEVIDAGDLTLEVVVGGHAVQVLVAAGSTQATAVVRVPAVARWWPQGYGGQPLHDVAVTLRGGTEILDSRAASVGFRTVEVEEDPDADGTSFALRVNGTRILVRGYNWIPDDPFLSRLTQDRYAARIQDAVASNANLLRVWGGGIYESEDFYRECDQAGILVWQDFLFACAAYPEEAELADEVRAEAREAVARLSSHPSLALWCGGNECIWGFEDGGWQEELRDRSWGAGYYHSLLPSIVNELDPTRAYIPGSPYAPLGHHPNDPAHGPMHIWDVWNERDYTSYLAYSPRFVSEFGFQGPPAWSTLTSAVHDDPLTPDSPGMRAHQKADDGNAKLARGLVGHLPEPVTIEDWHWATSLNQARAVALGIEHFRSLAPLCSGSIVWQLNDCWPVTSWSAVDSAGHRKPLWYAVRHAFRDRLLTFSQGPNGVELRLLNDADQPWRESLVIDRRDFSGVVLAHQVFEIDLGPRDPGTIRLSDSLRVPGDARRELMRARSASSEAWWWFAEDVDLDLPRPQVNVDVTATAAGAQVVVEAGTLVKDLALFVDRLDATATVDNMLVTLLPGERATFTVTGARGIPAERFADPHVLRSAGDMAP